MAFLTPEQLEVIGFKNYGENVYISEKASIYGPENIELGHDIRIDDFAIISAGQGGIKLCNYIHIGCYTSISGMARIEIGSFSGTSSHVSIFSSTDTFMGGYLAGPMVSSQFKKTKHEPVTIGKQVFIGSGSIILPGVTLNDGVSVGALSLIRKSIPQGVLVIGNPPRKIGLTQRPNEKLSNLYLKSINGTD